MAGFVALILVVAGLALLRRQRIVSLALFIAAGVAISSSAIFVVPAGHVGVTVLFGQVNERPSPEGLHLKQPFASVEKISIRTETYTMAAMVGGDPVNALSADGLEMPVDVSIAYRLIGSDAASIYRNIGANYEEKLIRPAARAAIRDAASRFTAQEAYSIKRAQLATEMKTQLIAHVTELLASSGVKGQGFVIQDVLLRNVVLPERVAHAIQDKLAADQDAQRMSFVLEKEKKEAERKRIEAEGIKDFQAIVSQGIDEKLLRWKGIEATRELAASPNAKMVIVGGRDGLPLILNTDTK